MTKMKKVLCSLMAIAAIAVPMTANVSDVAFADASICNLYTEYCESSLSISGKTATCKSQVTGSTGKATKVVVEQTLQKKTSTGSWSNVKIWSKTLEKISGTVTNTKSDLSKGTYRLRTKATVYSGNKSEVITKYSSSVTVK